MLDGHVTIVIVKSRERVRRGLHTNDAVTAADRGAFILRSGSEEAMWIPIARAQGVMIVAFASDRVNTTPTDQTGIVD